MPAPPLSAYPPGTTLTVGSHEVVTEQFIGEGGFAHVYTVRVSPPIPGQEIACLKRVQVPNKNYLNLLRAEVEAMQRLKGSSNIVEYYDSHAERMKQLDTPGNYEVFLLMEYCSKGGLIDFMNTRLRDQLREHEILKIMYDITLGLAHMHYLSPPLLHRDLKIENVLIRGDGTYMLCDFGSASPVLRTPKNPAEFRILEDDIQHHTTVQYRAPEMIDLSLGHPIDEKSDIWALGIFLYKLCYYTTPFERPNQTLEQFQALILSSSYTIPPRPAYSERLRNMIRILLQPDPRMRPNVFQVMQEVCAMRHVECPIQDIYSRPRPVAQPTTMPGLQMIPQHVHVQPPPAAAGTPVMPPQVGAVGPTGAVVDSPVMGPGAVPLQVAQNPPGKTLPQPVLSTPAASAPQSKHTRAQSEGESMSPMSTSSPEPEVYETEDDLAARYPSVEEIDRTMSFSSAKVPRRRSTDMSGGSGTAGTSGGASSGGGTPSSPPAAAGGNAPLIDLDSPPAKPLRPKKELLAGKPSVKPAAATKPSVAKPSAAKPAVRPPVTPVAGKPPTPARPLAKPAPLSPTTEYPMPQRPRSKQPSPAAVSSDTSGVEFEDDEDDTDDVGRVPESRMNPEASKLKQILTGISERPSMVIMDKPEENKSMSSVDFLRTLGNEGPSSYHHPHLHMHTKSRKHSLFYNSASISSTRHLHTDEDEGEEDEDDDAYEFDGVRVRLGQSGSVAPEDAYVTTDDDLDEEGQRVDFSESAPASPLASPAKIVPARAPDTNKRHSLPAKPAKPGAKPFNLSSQTARPPAKLPAKPGKMVGSTPPSPRLGSSTTHSLVKPVTFSTGHEHVHSLGVGLAVHSTSGLDAFKPTNSIQQRVRALLNGHERQHPPVRTAKGYGRFTDEFDGGLKPATRSKSMGSEVREVRELREMAPAVPSRDSKPKARLPRSYSASSLVKQK